LTLSRKYNLQPPLTDFVEAIWLYEGDVPPHAKELRLPDGSMELVINLHEDTIRVYDREHADQVQSFSGCVLGGTHSQFSVLDSATFTSTVGAHFKPGGAFPFLGMPATELSDQVIDLSALWGRAAVDLREQLLESKTTETRFHILEQTLLKHTGAFTSHHPSVIFALAEFQADSEQHSISEVTAQLSLSPKRFIKLFRETVGLTPKLYCRILRFQKALYLINKGQQIEWADIAAFCGYYDQAHFIHDFQAFSGLTPSTYLMQRGAYPNHVPLNDC
jgi:AraC-like DNA-binding protein